MQGGSFASAEAAGQMLAGLQYADSQFPGGAFAFSWGLEGLVADGLVTRENFGLFLRDQVVNRWLSFDRFFVESAAAYCTDLARLEKLDETVDAWTPVETQCAGSTRSGRALLGMHVRLGLDAALAYKAHAQISGCPCHVPVVTGLVLGARGLEAGMASAAAVHGVLAGGVTAAIRLGLVSHVDAQRAIESLRPDIACALAGPAPCEDELHAFTPLSEIAMMRHARRELRLFSN